jgi:hypothetical protein
MLELLFMKFGMYIMAPGPISAAYFINPPSSICVCICIPLSLSGNGSVKALMRQWIHTQQWKNCLTRSFLHSPCRIKGEFEIGSSQNFFTPLTLFCSANSAFGPVALQWALENKELNYKVRFSSQQSDVYSPKNRGLIQDKAKYTSLHPTSRLALETAHSPIQLVPEAHFFGVIAAGTCSEPSHSTNAEGKNEWTFTISPHIYLELGVSA